MMSPERLRVFLVPSALALALGTGCPRPALLPGETARARSAEELLRRIDLAEAAVASVRGEGALALDGPEGKGSAGIYLEAAVPASLRFEQLDFFGRPVSVLVSDGVRLGFYDAQAGRYVRGPATPENLARFVPVSVPMAELVAILTGRVPRLEGGRAELAPDVGRGRYRLRLVGERFTQVLEVDPASSRVVRSATEPAGLAYALEHDEVVLQGGVTFPKRTRLELPVQRATLDLRWRDVTLNQAPDAAAFQVEPPEGVPVVDLDAAGAVATDGGVG